jgi:hypothetical protein
LAVPEVLLVSTKVSWQSLIVQFNIPALEGYCKDPAGSIDRALPPGLALNTTTGTISGTPTTAGSYSFIIAVTDSKARPPTVTKDLTLTVLLGRADFVLTGLNSLDCIPPSVRRRVFFDFKQAIINNSKGLYIQAPL